MINLKEKIKKVSLVLLAAAIMMSSSPIRAFADSSTATDADAEMAARYDGIKLRNNIFINGTDMSGLSYEEAVSRLGGLGHLESANVTITSDYGDLVATLGELGLSDNTNEVIKEAFEYGNSGNILKRYRDQKMLEKTPVEYTTKRTISSDVISQMVDSNISGKMSSVSNYQLNKNGDGTVSVTADGQAVSADCVATGAAVEEKINASDYSGSDISTPLVLSDSTENERLKALGRIKNLLGTYTTSYASSSSSRKTNVQRAASLVDGHVLFPGEQISVYSCIAPIEVSNGYELAHAYVGTDVVDSPGGGVCQVATTLYNAVIRAELNVIQRNCHSMKVSYVPVSADAAIAGGVLDLRFSNNLEAPIYIEALYDGANLSFNVWGEEYRPSNRKIEFESIQTGVINPPAEPIYTEDKSLPPGTEVVSRSAVTGYTGELWKHVYVDGVETEKVKMNSSKYQASPAMISINTDEASDEENEDEDDNEGEDGEKKKKKKKKKKQEEEPSDTEAPATEAPATEAPTTEAPATEAPATEAPATEAPAPVEPVTEAPVPPVDPGVEGAQ